MKNKSTMDMRMMEYEIFKKKQKDSFDKPFLAYINLTQRGFIRSENGNFHFKCI